MKGRTYCELLYIERVAFSPILDLVVVNDQFNGHIVGNLWLTLLILRDVSATDLYEYLAQLMFSIFYTVFPSHEDLSAANMACTLLILLGL